MLVAELWFQKSLVPASRIFARKSSPRSALTGSNGFCPTRQRQAAAVRSPSAGTAPNEGLGGQENDCKDQPKTDHGMHPPETGGAEPRPEVKVPSHVKAGEANRDDRRSRVPAKPMFDRSKRRQLFISEIAPALGRLDNRLCHPRSTIQITTARTCRARTRTTSCIALHGAIGRHRPMLRPAIGILIASHPNSLRSLPPGEPDPFALAQTAHPFLMRRYSDLCRNACSDGAPGMAA